jgi:hypothetical protein
MNNKIDDMIPAILTAVSAVYLGLNKRGKKLKHVAKDSINCLLEGENKPSFKPKKNHRARARRKEETTV